MANKKKILINDDNIDQFIRIDLGRTFHEIQKEKYDNDFDLSRQFRIERDRSRNFRIYGKLSSTIIDCNNLTLEIYSDANYSDLYSTTQSSTYSFDTDNIFRRKNGKYLIELNNYPFDSAYIRLVSDDFYYEDQSWEQKLVFYNVDGDFVSYGTNTFDFDAFGESALIIENDFYFFFNKHWIRLDLDVKEEKPREISFSTTGDEIEEGQVFNMQIYLNEASPFGNETCLFNLTSPATNFSYYFGQVASQTLEGEEGSQGIMFRNVGGNLAFYTALPSGALGIVTAGFPLVIGSGSYVGTHVILNVEEISFFNPYNDPDVEGDEYYTRYRITLDTSYDPDADNADETFSNIINYNIGSVPDIAVLLNGEPIEFPYPMSWEENEISKDLQIIVNDDVEIELKEEFTFSFSEKFRLENGIIPVSQLYILDQTERGKVKFSVGDVYKNRLLFEGRKAYNSNFSNNDVFDYSSPSVLRNGASWQGINAEFFPCDTMVVKIRNTGINSVIPVNPVFGLDQEIAILAGEEKSFPVKIGYDNFVPHKIKATYTGSTSPSDYEFYPVSKDFIVNGIKIPVNPEGVFHSYYVRFKAKLDGGQYDYIKNQGLEKDFKATFDDNESSITFSSKDGGGFLTVEITVEGWHLETIQEYTPSNQSGVNFELYANTANQKCYYEISFVKEGYRTMVVPPDFLETSEEGVNKYLVNVLGNVLTPYDQENEECFYLNRSIYNGGNFYGLGNVIPDSEDILTTFIEDEGEQGYAGTPMPLSEKVYTNHIALLSDNILPNSRLNLTTYGRFNLYGEILEAPFWGSNPVEVIPCTDENIVSFPTKKVIDVHIPFTDFSEVDGYRGFDFKLNNDVLYKIGRAGGSNTLHGNASIWWENGDQVWVYNSESEALAGNPSMQEVIDVGDSDGNFGGLVDGELIEVDKLRMRSKFLAQDFAVTNIDQYTPVEDTADLFQQLLDGFVNIIQEIGGGSNNTGGFNFAEYDPNFGMEFANPFGNTSNNFFISDEEELGLAGLELSQTQLDVLGTYITAQTIVPNLLVGDANVGRNGLGGFAYQI